MDVKPTISVQVCYARPGVEFIRDVTVEEGATARDAIAASQVLVAAPEIDTGTCRIGIYGKLKTLDDVLRDRDRVEIYRPLVADPKQSRRMRADRKAGGGKAA